MRAAGALAHLMLVVVLALGVFVMHAVGHPEGASETGVDGMTHVSASVHSAPAPSPGVTGAHDPASHDTGMSMDMTTLCVAVLGVWALARLVLAAFGSRPDWMVRLLGRLTRLLAPNAPPPISPDLAQLSVLRI
ncbi:DUF6153 family protein [Streptomyces sp. Je 1-79]|uniref:DUF6153 family protein n=1 Tax=Streptomyces sp. Je 1-79 TaxID=2943847 RepID=UPI0021A6BA74|nr:DUF6153 family protein [Streptomyces sp. Je 1-79]MCT4353526.1 DUF6153 family protein [Streptomyces sp. Je 1-79]